MTDGEMIASGTNTLVVIDECDQLLMDRPMELNKLLKKSKCVALTASPGTQASEKEILSTLEFH